MSGSGARLLGLPAPFSPIQVLWVNLIMDGPPALALGADPTRPEVMDRPPRDPDASILENGRLRRLVLAGAIMAAGTIGVFAWMLDRGPDDGGALAGAMAFTTFVLFQFVNALNARLEHTTVFDRHTLRNGKLWLTLAGVLALQVPAALVVIRVSSLPATRLRIRRHLAAAAHRPSLPATRLRIRRHLAAAAHRAVHVPAIGGLVGVVPLSVEQRLAAAGIASTLLLVEELRKVSTAASCRLVRLTGASSGTV